MSTDTRIHDAWRAHVDDLLLPTLSWKTSATRFDVFRPIEDALTGPQLPVVVALVAAFQPSFGRGSR